MIDNTTKYKILIILLIIGALFLSSCSSQAEEGKHVKPDQEHSTVDKTIKDDVNKAEEAQEAAAALSRSVRFMAVGDVIAHDTVNQAAYKTKTDSYDYTNMLKMVLPILGKADIAFANQESMSSHRYPITGYPIFNAPYDLIDSLVNAGFNLISLANNHSLDTGVEALQDTTTYYANNHPEITVHGAYPGQEDFRFEVFEKNGITFTYAAFTEFVNVRRFLNDGEVMLINDEYFFPAIDALVSEGDVNIVSLHYGIEDSQVLTDADIALAQALLDRGVEIVLMHHPHVWKPIYETVNSEGNDAIVAYSLGNFLHSQLYEPQRLGGILDFTVSLTDERVEIDLVSVYLTYMHYVWGDPEQRELLSRHDLHVVPLESLHHFSSYEHQEALLEIIDGIVDDKYLRYIPPTPYSNPQRVRDVYDPLMIVNKHYFLPNNFAPQDLIKPAVRLSERTHESVHIISASIERHIAKLFNAAKNEAGHDLVFVSGYRDYSTQKSLYESYAARTSIEEADTFSARAGYSEHQTGIAFDLSTADVDHLGLPAFSDTEAAQWIADNAHRFGFIIRYPAEKQDIHQYMYESWHLRWVGQEHAEYMYTHGLTLEEYVHEKQGERLR